MRRVRVRGLEVSEASALAALMRVLSAKNAVVRVSRGRVSATLPESLVALLREAAGAALRGDKVAVLPVQHLVTTQEAADLLGVSRQHLVRLLDACKVKIRSSKTGTHRRLALADVLRLKDEKEAAVEKAVQIARELDAAFGAMNAPSHHSRLATR